MDIDERYKRVKEEIFSFLNAAAEKSRQKVDAIQYLVAAILFILILFVQKGILLTGIDRSRYVILLISVGLFVFCRQKISFISNYAHQIAFLIILWLIYEYLFGFANLTLTFIIKHFAHRIYLIWNVKTISCVVFLPMGIFLFTKYSQIPKTENCC